MLKNIFCLFAVIFLQMVFATAFAEGYVSNGQIVSEIEKTLLFDKESHEKINVYKKDRSKKRSDITINSDVAADGQKSSSTVDVVVVDSGIGNFDVREKEKIAYNAALIGQYEVAIEFYKQVLSAEPDNIYDQFALAVVYQKLGQFSQAKNLYYQILKSDPSNREEIVSNLLSILIEESPKDAVYFLSRLATQNPQSAYIFAQAGIAYDKIKDSDHAIMFLKKAVSLDPSNVNYQYNLAVIYDKNLNYEKALEMYSEAASRYSDEDQSIPINQVQKRIELIKIKLQDIS